MDSPIEYVIRFKGESDKKEESRPSLCVGFFKTIDVNNLDLGIFLK